ncbi:MAG: hypothetical protein KKF41_08560 [Actinobacteria bacterium]|nr:hypothetical protein [Actinomycetota bacterium]MBU1942893.1 hypothetical protein [Actinomycetota bacterium]MBU2687625.1 hypothetical protein [Actinomycetota bacterium]
MSKKKTKYKGAGVYNPRTKRPVRRKPTTQFKTFLDEFEKLKRTGPPQGPV